IWGEVHDPNAWAMGGVAGHAGLFGSARDLAVFAQMLLNGGEYGSVRILQPQTVARWTAPQGPGASRALGWDTPSGESSAGRFFSTRSFGHTGYTGTSLWMDPERGLFVILLTTRVNPTAENNKHVAMRRAVADAVQSAVVDAPLVDWEARRKAAQP
ncbi:MAG TPA: serine hydrolase, partial [Longimicrobium sp.]|nr:serine hydrolase [Longimicrobium sp.]